MTETLQLWIDDDPRDGPENMAVDQWLLETAETPILRVYRWSPGWGSFGFFVPLNDAEVHSPDRSWVRRWTGGGIVDHARDWTYTVVDPGRDGLAGLRGAASYRVIHEALANALRSGGHEVVFAPADEPSRGGDCFSQPVEHDLCDRSGKKISGAGQRRTKHGLLHQGSLAVVGDDGLATRFASALAKQVECALIAPPAARISEIVTERYGSEAWLNRR